MKDVRPILLTLCLAFPLTFQFPAGFESRIANGAQAAQGEFPYVASVQTWNDEHLCSGFIYSTYHIVTAASCVSGKMASDLKVLVGTASLISHSDETQMVSVYRVDVHPSYNSTIKANDIALLKLASTLFFSTYVQHIPYDEVDAAITTAATMGWGATEEGGLVTVNLRKMTLSLRPATECQNSYGAEFSQNYMICAGNDVSSPCKYDEGSPLVQNGIAVGIMSRNAGCTAPYSPTIYTRLSAHYSWLLRFAGSQPPQPNTPYPTVAPPTTTTAALSSPTTTGSTAGPSTETTTKATTTPFTIPTAPCANCVPD